MSKGIAVCTSVAGNYLAFARVFAASFQRYHPGIPLHILLPDGQTPGDTVEGAEVHMLRLEDLHIPALGRMLIRYDRKQVLVAAKPALLRHMLESGYQTAIYLDPDMLVTGSLDPMLEEVARHALSLTPHIGPRFATAERTDLERSLLLAGMYNGGVVGVTHCDESRRFLAWWEERLQTHCVEAVREGLHYDQRWLDMAPALVADLHLLRDPGVNVAYWNLPDLDVRAGRDGLLVNNAPLRLFHFSGFDPARPQRVSRYEPELKVEEADPVADLFRRYAALLNEAGWDETSKRPWPWDGWRRVPRSGARLLKLLSRNPLQWLPGAIRLRRALSPLHRFLERR